MNNPGPTQATEYVKDKTAPFSRGAGMSVDNGSQASGNRPETIASRKENGFKGDLQPIRKGIRYKFIDSPANHPAIPKSSFSAVTQEIDDDDLPKTNSGNVKQIPGM